MAATEELRNDMLWRREAPESLPARSLHFADQGGIAWHSRLHALRDKALSTVPEAVCTVYADAAGPSGWGSELGDQCNQGVWSKVALWEGISGRAVAAKGGSLPMELQREGEIGVRQDGRRRCGCVR